MASEKRPNLVSDTTRRQFLKTSAATAAVAGGLSVARSAHAAGTQEINIGMIGCGGRCSGAAAQALDVGPDVKLAAMTDVFESRMAAKRKFFQGKYALCQTRLGCYSLWDDVIMGTKGVCHWSNCRIEGETNWRYEGPRNNAHAEEQKILIGSIRDGRPVNHGDTMIDSTYLAIMGQIACYEGKTVTWEKLMQADFEFEPKVDEVHMDMEPPVRPDASGNYPLPVPGVTKYI